MKFFKYFKLNNLEFLIKNNLGEYSAFFNKIWWLMQLFQFFPKIMQLRHKCWFIQFYLSFCRYYV